MFVDKRIFIVTSRFVNLLDGLRANYDDTQMKDSRLLLWCFSFGVIFLWPLAGFLSLSPSRMAARNSFRLYLFRRDARVLGLSSALLTLESLPRGSKDT